MDARTKARYDAQAKIIKALAHPSRLMIMEELNRQTRCTDSVVEANALGQMDAELSCKTREV